MASSKQRINRRRRQSTRSRLRSFVAFWRELGLAVEEEVEPWSVARATAFDLVQPAAFRCPLGELVGGALAHG